MLANRERKGIEGIREFKLWMVRTRQRPKEMETYRRPTVNKAGWEKPAAPCFKVKMVVDQVRSNVPRALQKLGKARKRGQEMGLEKKKKKLATK